MTAGGAWFCVGWGVLATSMGLPVATDHRGAVDRFLAANAKRHRGLPLFGGSGASPVGPEARIIVRAVGGLFACAGVVVLIVGVVTLARR